MHILTLLDSWIHLSNPGLRTAPRAWDVICYQYKVCCKGRLLRLVTIGSVNSRLPVTAAILVDKVVLLQDTGNLLFSASSNNLHRAITTERPCSS